MWLITAPPTRHVGSEPRRGPGRLLSETVVNGEEIALDDLQLLVGELLVDLLHGLLDRRVGVVRPVGSELYHSLGAGANYHAPAVGRIGDALDETPAFEAIEHPGRRAGRQAGEGADLPGGERLLAASDHAECLPVHDTHAERASDVLVGQD